MQCIKSYRAIDEHFIGLILNVRAQLTVKYPNMFLFLWQTVLEEVIEDLDVDGHKIIRIFNLNGRFEEYRKRIEWRLCDK